MLRTLRDTTLENQTILVSDKGENAYAALGPNLELRGCTVILRISPKMLTLAGPRLIRCVIEAKKPLGQVRWCNAYIEWCRLIGSFTSNDFGHWPEYFRPDGGFEGGDLRAAKLNGCRFINVNTEKVTFPSWPCFTILRPAEQAAAAFARVAWPYEWRFFAKAYTDVPPVVTAITGLATYIVKKYGGTEEELRTILARMDNVVM